MTQDRRHYCRECDEILDDVAGIEDGEDFQNCYEHMTDIHELRDECARLTQLLRRD